jgi:hypothetical protein
MFSSRSFWLDGAVAQNFFFVFLPLAATDNPRQWFWREKANRKMKILLLIFGFIFVASGHRAREIGRVSTTAPRVEVDFYVMSKCPYAGKSNDLKDKIE